MSDRDALSDCFHLWRAVDSRRSQCSKCGEIRRSPCDEPECVALRARVAELEKDAARLKRGLKFYADQMHFDHQGDEWDTVSGEPESIWCHEDGNSTVEDGAVARRTLEGWDLPDNPDAEGMIPPVAQQEGEV